MPFCLAICPYCGCAAPKGFNARHGAKKRYTNTIFGTALTAPVWQGAKAWHVKAPLGLALMRKAAKLLCGRRNFSSFEAKNSVLKSKIASLSSVKLASKSGKITITFSGDRFLYKMAPIMAGTLVEVGLKRVKPEKIPSILLSKRRLGLQVVRRKKGLRQAPHRRPQNPRDPQVQARRRLRLQNPD